MEETLTPRPKSLDVTAEQVAFTDGGRRYAFERIELPESFLGWLLEGRRAMFDQLEGRGTAPFFGTHLPVVVTKNRGEAFPFNTGNKGVGPVPAVPKVSQYCALYEETFARCQALDWEESLPLRLAAVRRFIDGDDVSSLALASLEIFEKTTFRNLCDFPLATLHYTGSGPVYKSFQVNAVVEILTPEEPYYRFAFWSRRLFEYDSFHITQTMFPYAYLFHPVEVREKTPRPRR